MVMFKTAGILIFIFGVFGLFVFGPWYANLPLQLGLVFALIFWSSVRHGLIGTLRSLWFIVPFVLTLILFGAVFQWLALMGRTDWLFDSLVKAVVFPNSYLAVKLGLESITFTDLIRLPLKPRSRRAVFILKTVMEKCTPLLHRYRYFMELSPHFRGRRWERLTGLCGAIVATYISIYQITEQTRDLYDHRLRHLKEHR